MEVAGLALGAIPLAIQLFQPTVVLYKTYSESKELGPISVALQLQLRIEQLRYRNWGEYMGLDVDVAATGKAKVQFNEWWATHKPYLELILDTMALISQKLMEVCKVEKKYKLGWFTEPSSSGWGGSWGSLFTPPTQLPAPNITSPSDFTELSTIRQKYHQQLAIEIKSRNTLLSSIKFTVFGKGKLEALISELRQFNDNLENITGYQAQLRGKLFLQLLDTPGEHSESQQELTALGDATANVQPVLAEMANRKAIFLELKKKAMASYNSPQARNQISSALASDPGPRLTDSKLVIDTHRRSRDFGTYEGAPVMVEWKILSAELPGDEGISRVGDLARFLGGSKAPVDGQNASQSLHILDCLGYLKRLGKNDAVALVYRLSEPPHRNLSDLIGNDEGHKADLNKQQVRNFSLGTRLRLARELAECIFYIHLTGWLHKGINSTNVVISGDETLPGGTRNLRLFLVGFNSSRLDRPGEISEKLQNDEEAEIYHHPAYQGPKKLSTRYSRRYDIYSLGLVLLELGSWQSILESGGYKPAKYNAAKFLSRLLRGPVDFLTSTMGNDYKKAVLWCLKDQFDDDASSMTEEQTSQAFWEAVVMRLANAKISE